MERGQRQQEQVIIYKIHQSPVSDQHSEVSVQFYHAHAGMLLEDHMQPIHPMTNSNNPKQFEPDI